jgi:hypothetical protein
VIELAPNHAEGISWASHAILLEVYQQRLVKASPKWEMPAIKSGTIWQTVAR